MTTELWLLVASIFLGFIHLFLQANSTTVQRGYRWNVSPRDDPGPPLTGIAGRLNRAFRNFLETFAFFAAAVLLAHAVNIENALTWWGAWLYVVGRVIYLPLYAYGVIYFRSLAWIVATIGILLVLAGAIAGATAR